MPGNTSCNDSTYVPQSEAEPVSQKAYSTTKYNMKKRDSRRYSSKEERARKSRAFSRILKKYKSQGNDIKPHSGSETQSFQQFSGRISEFMDSVKVSRANFDQCATHCENLIMLSYMLCKSRSLDECFVSVIAYMKFYVKQSITVLLAELLDSTPRLEFDQFSDASENYPESDEELRFGGFNMEDMKDCWTMLKTNTIFSKISYLLTAAMASSVCTIKNIDFDIAGVKLIHLEALKEQANCVDIIDAVISTFTWIAETGICCFRERSLAPILYDDQRLRIFTTSYNEVASLGPLVQSGNVPDLDAFETKVDACLVTAVKLLAATKSPVVRELMTRKHITLTEIKADIDAKKRNTQFRFQPLGLNIYGESAIGKSNISQLTMKTCLNAMGESDDPRGIATLNEAEKYHSTYTSDVKGLFIDDANNANPNFIETSPTQTYIQFFNNIPAQAVKAELQLKGNVFINFKVGVLTTNTKELGANVYSNYPVAVLRRFIHVTVTVKPKYRVPGFTSLNTDHPEIRACPEGQYVDVWLFKIEQCLPNGQKMGEFQALEIPIDGTVKRCVDLNLREYLCALVHISQEHKKKQESQVKSNKIFSETKCCPKCFLLPQFCLCPVDEIPIDPDSPTDPPLPKFYTKPRRCAQCLRSVGWCVCPGPPEEKPSDKKEEDEHSSDDMPESINFCIKCKRFECTCSYACPDCDRSALSCICDDCPDLYDDFADDIKPHALAEATRTFFGMVCYSNIQRYVWSRFILDTAVLSGAARVTDALFDQYFVHHHQETFFRHVPMWLIRLPVFQRCVHNFYASRYNPNLIQIGETAAYVFVASLALMCVFAPFVTWWHLSFMALFTSVSFACTTYCAVNVLNQRKAVQEMMLRNGGQALRAYGTTVRRYSKEIVCGLALGTGTVIAVLKLWNAYRKLPHSLSEPQDFDKKPGWMGYLLGIEPTVPVKSKVQGAMPEHLLSTVEKNICWARFEHPNGYVNKCCAFFPRKSMMLIPHHIFYDQSDMTKECHEELKCTVTRDSSPGGKFKIAINKNTCYVFERLDMVAVYVPNSPDFRTKYKWFLDEKPKGKSNGYMSTIDEKGERSHFPLTFHNTCVSHKYQGFYGASYKAEHTREGSCMSVLVSDTASPAIIGFHIGGNTVTKMGIAQTVLRSDLERAEEWLERVSGCLSAHATDLPTEQYDIPVLVDTSPHAKAEVYKYMDNESTVEVIGSTRLRAETKSRVEESMLSPYITQIVGVSNKWGPPRLKPNWKPFNANLAQIADAAGQFDPLMLMRAKVDYLLPLVEAMLKYKKWEDFRPLTMKEVVNGIPGKRFVDAIPMNTGVGFPLFGKKNKLDAAGNPLHFIEKRDDDGFIERVPKAHILQEYHRMLDCYKNNVRAYPVTSATLKDEPTPVDKEKVRVFQAAPIALSLLIRKYFLPVSRFLCVHPLIAETAVGVNAFSRDWEELITHAKKYAEDEQMLAWDYSKYDVRMNSQMTRAVWEVFIDLAIAGGYDNDSVSIMRAMIVDITHPLVDMNGTMIMATSMNTSGNNMTVFVNSLAGSLYVRLGFLDQYPEAKNIRECVSLLTYGDDAIGSVKPDYSNFNFMSYKKFLERHGMKLTLPNKSDDEVPFLEYENTDFLKRKSNFIPEIGCAIGMLDEDSIFKSLHSNIKSPNVTKREVSHSCVEGALHEWFAFGREHYEKRRAQMQEVCELAQLPVAALEVTFDERVAAWQDKYKVQE